MDAVARSKLFLAPLTLVNQSRFNAGYALGERLEVVTLQYVAHAGGGDIHLRRPQIACDAVLPADGKMKCGVEDARFDRCGHARSAPDGAGPGSRDPGETVTVRGRIGARRVGMVTS